jgi:hypothetical protein
MIEVQEGNFWHPDDFLDSHPRFWDDVRQLAFAFDEEDEDRVCRFCCEYGRLGRYPLPMLHESWAYLKDIVGWFQMLTCLTEAVKERRTGFLREFGREYTDEDVDRGFRPGYFHTSYGEWEGRDSNLYYIRFPHDTDHTSPVPRYFAPQDDALLLEGTWRAITETAAIYLDSVRLVPLAQDFSNNRFPKVAWTFRAEGAVEAAFLQWFFTEFSQIQPTICAAGDCTNLVPHDRRKWCSDRCRERVKKRKAANANERGWAGE